MTPEERRQGAFEEFDELLSQGVAIEDAIICAAQNNEMKPDVFRTVAEKQLGELQEHAHRLRLRALNEAIAAEVKLASSKRRPGSLFHDCYEPDEVATAVERRIGRSLSDDEIPKIHEARRDYVHRQVRELSERLG